MKANRINKGLGELTLDERRLFEGHSFDKGALDFSLNKEVATEDQLRLILTIAKYCKSSETIIETRKAKKQRGIVVVPEKKGLLNADSPVLTVGFGASQVQPHQGMSAYVLPPIEILRHAKRIGLDNMILNIADATHFSNSINDLMTDDEAERVISSRKDFIARDLREHLDELGDQVQFVTTPDYSEEIRELIELMGDEALEVLATDKVFTQLVKSSEKHCKNPDNAPGKALKYLLGHLFVFGETSTGNESDLQAKFGGECEKGFSKLQERMIDLLGKNNESRRINVHPNIRRIGYRKEIGRNPPYYTIEPTQSEIDAVEASRIH